MIGKTLAHYQILAQIGAGGMGVVYRARDTRLDRDVALKLLPDDVTSDPERLARFRKEARLLASLNHPGIAAIHGIEESEGQLFLVLEYVHGETLAARLKRGRPTVPEGLLLLRDIAVALAAAHAQGVIHRDLKPANVMIEPDGRVRILDFGLAKSLASLHAERRAADTGARATSELSAAATTESVTVTESGRIVGTVSYMSPEQAKGEASDRRADVWAFGCVMYEVLTGKRLFDAPTITETLAAILKEEPDWEKLPAGVPDVARSLLRRCLRKDRDRRLHDLADAAIEIDEVLDLLAHPVPTARQAPRRSARWVLMLAPLLAASLCAGFLARGYLGKQEPHDVKQLAITLPATDALALDQAVGLALSPDGRRLVYLARRDGRLQLFLREMDGRDASAIPGTEGADYPFFSPDGAWVAFYASGVLKKASLERGTVLPLCEAPSFSGGAWGADGTIVFSGGRQGPSLFTVPAAGGTPRPLDVRIEGPAGTMLFFATPLPEGKGILAVTSTNFIYEPKRIVAIDPAQGTLNAIAEGSGRPVYLPTGHVVFARGGSLVAVPFDIRRLEPRGDPFVVSEETSSARIVEIALALDGTLAYVLEEDLNAASGSLPEYTPVWVDRAGRIEPLGAPSRRYVFPNLSPDGKHVAFSIMGDEEITDWIYSLERGTLSRLTLSGNDHLPIWTPDGKRITYASDLGGPPNIYWMAADGTGEPERLTWSEFHQCPCSWSPNGRYLLYADFSKETSSDILFLDMDGDRQPQRFRATNAYESHGMVSPDGGWVAYTSSLSGQVEVYVERFPAGGNRVQISVDGGNSPMWSPIGNELFYWGSAPPESGADENRVRVYAADIQTHGPLSVGKPKVLFDGEFLPHGAARPNYDVTRDGQRFLFLMAGEAAIPVREIHVVLNWGRRLRER